MLRAEQDTRASWVQRHESEVAAHQRTGAELLQTKSQLKDERLNVQAGEVKLGSVQKQVQMLQEQAVKNQHALNEAATRCEQVERDLATQKEIMTQIETQKREYIQRLKAELETVESKWQSQLTTSDMAAEDHRSQAFDLLFQLMTARRETKDAQEHTEQATEKAKAFEARLETVQGDYAQLQLQLTASQEKLAESEEN